MDTGQPQDPELFQAIIAASRHGEMATAEDKLWEQFGTVCAPLVLDSTGFMRIAHEHGISHYLDLFLQMRALVSPVFERHACLGWRTVADNLFAEFATPDQALDGAVEANLALHEARLMLDDEEPYGICIGIGYGHVLRGGHEGVFGDEMNRASKLGEDVAEGGEILLTEAAYEAVQRRKGTVFERHDVTVSGNRIAFYAVRR